MAVKENIIDFLALQQDFPILKRTNRGKPLIYLDSASSAQKPKQVIDAMSNFYFNNYANIHRGIYELSEQSSDRYEEIRKLVSAFIHAASADEIIFVKSATEGINCVAESYGRSQFKEGDEVIVSEMEHHSNIVPWYLLKDKMGIVLKIIPLNDDGSLDLAVYRALFSKRTKMVAVSHASNVCGTINPVDVMAKIAHEHGVPILLDGAQAAPHMPINMQEIDCDFYVFSGHKIYGPTGIGILYAKKAFLDTMPPYQGGGGMIERVSFSHITFAEGPKKFEAGTPPIAQVIGLGAAIRYVNAIKMENIFYHEQTLMAYAEEALKTLPHLRIIGTTKPKVGVISIVHDSIHPHDLGSVLDLHGVAIRAGHHCAMPLMERYHIPATVRLSFGLYNEESDIDALIYAIKEAERMWI